jgi:DNA repair exonuclease SbcCD nuclease subunit
VAAAERAITDGLLHYVALGDRHSVTGVGRSGRIHYAGAPEPTDFDEVDAGKVLLVDLGEQRCDVEAVPVCTWRFVRRDLDVTGPADVAGVEARLDDQPAKDRTILRLACVGTLSLRDAARLEEALERAGDVYAAVERWAPAEDLAVLPDDEDLAALDLSGFAQATADELRAIAAGAGGEERTAREALALLYRLSRGAA